MMYGMRESRQTRWARIVLWIGILAPYLYTTAKTVEDVQGGLNVLDVGRGVSPLLFLVLAHFIQPHAVRDLQLGPVGLGATWFLGVAVASAAWSVDGRTTLLITIPLVFSFVCLARLSRLYPTFSDAVCGLLTVVHVILIATIAQLAIVPGLAYAGTDSDPTARVHSFIPNISTNLFGLVIAAGVVSILMRVGPPRLTRGATSGVLLVLYLLMLVGTRSRLVTVVAVLVGFVALAAAMRRSRLAAVAGWLPIAVLFGACSWVLVSDAARTGVEQFAARGQNQQGLTTLTGRTVIWERALTYWQGQPWIGHGYYAGHRIGLASQFELLAGYSNIDNTWIETLVDVGLLGAAGLAAFAIGGLITVARAEAPKRVRRVATLIVGACLAMSLVNPGIQSTTSTLMLFGILAFAARRPAHRGGGRSLRPAGELRELSLRLNLALGVRRLS
jgi:O-antigen ligase